MKKPFYIVAVIVFLLLSLTGCNNTTREVNTNTKSIASTKGVTVDLANFSPSKSSIVMPRSLVEFNKNRQRVPTNKEAVLAVFSSDDNGHNWITRVDYQIDDIKSAKVFLPDNKNAIVVINKEAIDRFYTKDNRKMTIAIVYLDEKGDVQVSFVYGSIGISKVPADEGKLVILSPNGGVAMENHTHWDWFIERCSFTLYLKK